MPASDVGWGAPVQQHVAGPHTSSSSRGYPLLCPCWVECGWQAKGSNDTVFCIGTRLKSCSWLCPAGKQDSLSAVDLTTERLVAEVLHSAHTAAAASSSSGAAYTPLQRTLGSGGSAALGREAAAVSGLVSPGRGTLPRGGSSTPSTWPPATHMLVVALAPVA